MARLRPPQHRIDDQAVFIAEEDDAWDHERIDREARESGRDEHPVVRYWNGETRYQLTPEVKGYIDDTKRPESFTLKRIAARRFMQIQSLINSEEKRFEGYLEAFKSGLDGAENIPVKLKMLANGEVSEDAIDKVCEVMGPGIIMEVGVAAYIASTPLTEPEKKA